MLNCCQGTKQQQPKLLVLNGGTDLSQFVSNLTKQDAASNWRTVSANTVYPPGNTTPFPSDMPAEQKVYNLAKSTSNVPNSSYILNLALDPLHTHLKAAQFGLQETNNKAMSSVLAYKPFTKLATPTEFAHFASNFKTTPSQTPNTLGTISKRDMEQAMTKISTSLGGTNDGKVQSQALSSFLGSALGLGFQEGNSAVYYEPINPTHYDVIVDVTSPHKAAKRVLEFAKSHAAINMSSVLKTEGVKFLPGTTQMAKCPYCHGQFTQKVCASCLKVATQERMRSLFGSKMSTADDVCPGSKHVCLDPKPPNPEHCGPHKGDGLKCSTYTPRWKCPSGQMKLSCWKPFTADCDGFEEKPRNG